MPISIKTELKTNDTWSIPLSASVLSVSLVRDLKDDKLMCFKCGNFASSRTPSLFTKRLQPLKSTNCNCWQPITVVLRIWKKSQTYFWMSYVKHVRLLISDRSVIKLCNVKSFFSSLCAHWQTTSSRKNSVNRTDDCHWAMVYDTKSPLKSLT